LAQGKLVKVDKKKAAVDKFAGEETAKASTKAPSKKEAKKEAASAKELGMMAKLESDRMNEVIEFKFTGRELPKMDTMGKADPFIEMFAYREKEWVLVSATEVQRSTLKPVWPPLELKAKRFMTAGRKTDPIMIKVWDWNKSNPPDYIGEFSSTLQEMRTARDMEFLCINSELKSKNKAKYKHSGIITLVSAMRKGEKILSLEEEMALGGVRVTSSKDRIKSTANVH
jgi:hypothetical protein